MLSPTPIEFSPLGVGHFEGSCTLSIREAFPQGDGEFRPIPGREFQELRKGAGCHGLIVSRIDVRSNILARSYRVAAIEFRLTFLNPRSEV